MRYCGARARSLLAVSWFALLGSTPAAGIAFREVSREWGITFRHHHGGSGQRYMVETVCGGVVAFDYDQDGDVDLLFVDGGALPGYRGEPPRTRLYRNDTGRFTDVTDRAELSFEGYGCGATAGDYDGDGDLDVYITAFGRNRLWRNDGDGTFSEVRSVAEGEEELWSASAAFGDADGDGDLDLYVTNYVDFTLENHKFCGDRERGIQGYCHPDKYKGLPDRYYENLGDGTFRDATARAGLGGAVGPGLGVLFTDLAGDEWPDLYVANDAKPNFLFRNRGDGTFEDVSLISGTAYSDKGLAEGGMGVDVGDVDGDGGYDIVVTNFELESNALYLGTGKGNFIDGRYRSGIAEPSLRPLAFGVALDDFDQDSDLDLVVANGHILDNAELFLEGSRYAQKNQIFENLGEGRYRERVDAGLNVVRVSRGLATADLDGDGDLDLVIVNSNDRTEAYENLKAPGAWAQVDLRGYGNSFGVGARVTARTAEVTARRPVLTASSYLSQDSMTVHLGLGDAERVERLEIDWPGGGRQVIHGLPANRRVLIRGGKPGALQADSPTESR